MNLSQETCLELNSSFSGKNDDCSGVALFMHMKRSLFGCALNEVVFFDEKKTAFFDVKGRSLPFCTGAARL